MQYTFQLDLETCGYVCIVFFPVFPLIVRLTQDSELFHVSGH